MYLLRYSSMVLHIHNFQYSSATIAQLWSYPNTSVLDEKSIREAVQVKVQLKTNKILPEMLQYEWLNSWHSAENLDSTNQPFRPPETCTLRRSYEFFTRSAFAQ